MLSGSAVMRAPLRMISVPALLLIATIISHASGAAVMSIDLGTEWMKVSGTYDLLLFVINDFLPRCFRSASCHPAYRWRSL